MLTELNSNKQRIQVNFKITFLNTEQFYLQVKTAAKMSLLYKAC